MLNQFITVKELSEWLRISRSQIYTLTSANEIPFNKVGGKILFDVDEIKVWIKNQSK
jgi:putative molybdopterin biosynthesis protein